MEQLSPLQKFSFQEFTDEFLKGVYDAIEAIPKDRFKQKSAKDLNYEILERFEQPYFNILWSEVDVDITKSKQRFGLQFPMVYNVEKDKMYECKTILYQFPYTTNNYKLFQTRPKGRNITDHFVLEHMPGTLTLPFETFNIHSLSENEISEAKIEARKFVDQVKPALETLTNEINSFYESLPALISKKIHERKTRYNGDDQTKNDLLDF